ncbi:hypothetical protein C9374_009616 [Naegleria lovaniensis]|uniref:Uncharacterized protein n=1 Tax=Naegleria lovaniensis TaxID=51637 RepID=A0AA88KRW0_NAELO|nr:uncharacterized protein C9374_009616 [Naegleria lovaniensis]KAG2393039.1 hypothetical protein C9374_009616 [Naegleria lovaniensis]
MLSTTLWMKYSIWSLPINKSPLQQLTRDRVTILFSQQQQHYSTRRSSLRLFPSTLVCAFLLIFTLLLFLSHHSELSIQAFPIWKNCSLETIDNTTPLLSCSSITLLNETTLYTRYESSVEFSLFYQFFDTKSFELCNEPQISTLFSKYNIESCESLYCQDFPKLINRTSMNGSNSIDSTNGMDLSIYVKQYLNDTYGVTSQRSQQRVVSEFAYMMNYCQYCKRFDFVEFHRNMSLRYNSASNSSTCFQYSKKSDTFCNYGHSNAMTRLMTGVTNSGSLVSIPDNDLQIPLLYGNSLLIQPTLNAWMCYCGNSKYGFKCDYFSTTFIGFTFQAYPVIAFVLPLCLILVMIISVIIPSFYRGILKVKDHMKHRMVKFYRGFYDEFFTLNWLAYICIVLHLVFLSLENLFALATSSMFQLKSTMGSGFFRAIHLLWIFTALFSTFVIWFNLLMGVNKSSKSANRSSSSTSGIIVLHPALKVLVLVFAALFILLLILPIVYIAIPSIAKIFNLTFFSLSLAITVLFVSGFFIFGARLYLLLRKANHLSIFQIKFTRAIMFLMFAAALVFIEMILIMIEYGAGQVVLGLFYRSVNFNTLDVSCCLVTLGMIYLFTPFDDLKQLYCGACLKRWNDRKEVKQEQNL